MSAAETQVKVGIEDASQAHESVEASPFVSLEGELRWKVTIAFDQLTLEVKAESANGAGKLETVGSALAESIKNLITGNFFFKGKENTADVLHQLSGCFESGTSTLILGPPGCGKSSFMKALGGQLQNAESGLSGSVKYSGVDRDKLNLKKVCAYVSQIDNHYPLMTVKQTFKFAHEAAGGDDSLRLKKSELDVPMDVPKNALSGMPTKIIQKLGLQNARDTVAGNQFFRGISGGELKRLTIGEMLFNRQPVLLLDEITTGLDSTTAYKIVSEICESTKSMHNTAVISLLQPSPELIGLFDEILLMSDGKILYHGPQDQALNYFESLGYVCPTGKPVAEFLEDVATVYRARYRKGECDYVTTDDLAKAWTDSEFSVSKRNQTQNVLIKNEDDNSYIYFTKDSPEFIFSWFADMETVLKRQMLLLWAEKILYFGLLMNLFFSILLTGALFWDIPLVGENATDTAWFAQRVAAGFFIIVVFGLNSFVSLPLFTIQRDIFYKHRDSSFHRTSSYVVATNIVSFLPTIFESVFAVIVAVFMTNLVDRNAPDFYSVLLIYSLYAIVTNVFFQAILKLVSYTTRTFVEAILISCFVMILLMCFSGFLITANDIQDHFLPLYWINPISWAFRGINILIFTSDSFSEADAEFALSVFGLEPDRYWIWAGIIYIFSCYLCLTFIHMFVLHKFRYGPKKVFIKETAVAEEDNQRENDAKVDINRSHESFTPVTVAFRNLSYSVPVSSKENSKKQKTLLNDIYGYAKPNEATALMGPSGAGKTTLMDVIAFRKTIGHREGDILVNGTKITRRNRHSFLRDTGYVEQKDTHSPFSTVYEVIKFSAFLKQGNEVSAEAKDAHIMDIISMLRLDSIQDVPIGQPGIGSGISKHQAKRVTIGVELAGNPSVMFLDEPTSGLDSQSAYIVMEAVRSVADSGRTVMCTIHQPSAEIFSFFDRLLLLQRGGDLVYFGPSNEATAHFERFMKLPYPEYNVADFVLDVVAAYQVDDTYSQSKKLEFEPNKLVTAFEESQMSKDGQAEIEQYMNNPSDLPVRTDNASLFTQTRFIVSRWVVSYWRNPSLNLVKIYTAIVIGLASGLLLLQVGTPTSQEELQSFLGLIFLQSLFFGFINSIASLSALMAERNVFYREKNSRMYPVVAYALGSALAELPYVMASSSILYTIFHFMVGLRSDDGAFFVGLVLYNLFILASAYFGHVLASGFSNVPTAVLAATAILSAWSLFCGFMISISQIPGYFGWLVDISLCYYYINGLVSTQLFCPCEVDPAPGVNITCDGGKDCADVCDLSLGGCSIFQVPAGPGITIPINVWQFTEGAFGFDDRVGEMILALFLFCVIFKIMDVILLTFFIKTKR